MDIIIETDDWGRGALFKRFQSTFIIMPKPGERFIGFPFSYIITLTQCYCFIYTNIMPTHHYVDLLVCRLVSLTGIRKQVYK